MLFLGRTDEKDKFDQYFDALKNLENEIKHPIYIEDEEIAAESKFLKDYIQVVQSHYKDQKKPFVL